LESVRRADLQETIVFPDDLDLIAAIEAANLRRRLVVRLVCHSDEAICDGSSFDAGPCRLAESERFAGHHVFGP
jgi:hypothetical protein